MAKGPDIHINNIEKKIKSAGHAPTLSTTNELWSQQSFTYVWVILCEDFTFNFIPIKFYDLHRTKPNNLIWKSIETDKLYWIDLQFSKMIR